MNKHDIYEILYELGAIEDDVTEEKFMNIVKSDVQLLKFIDDLQLYNDNPTIGKILFCILKGM